MGLVEELSTWCQIHPSQLVPATIRLFLCVDRLKKKYNLQFSAKDLFHSYFVKRKKPEIGRYVLNARADAQLLILGFSSNEPRWKDK